MFRFKLQNRENEFTSENVILSLDGAFLKNWDVASNVNNTKTLSTNINFIDYAERFIERWSNL